MVVSDQFEVYPRCKPARQCFVSFCECRPQGPNLPDVRSTLRVDGRMAWSGMKAALAYKQAYNSLVGQRRLPHYNAQHKRFVSALFPMRAELVLRLPTLEYIPRRRTGDRKRVVEVKSVSVRVDPGGGRDKK